MSAVISIEVSPYKLKRARGSRSVQTVVDALGISRQHLWQIENGKCVPSAHIVARMCWLYDVEITDLTIQSRRKAA